jgi:hypothetical protein
MAPLHVLAVRELVCAVVPILLAQIERWICEDGVHHFVPDDRQDLHAITIEEGSSRGDVVRMDRLVLQECGNLEIAVLPLEPGLANKLHG